MVINRGDTGEAVDFLADTFGGSQEFYEAVIPAAAVAAAYEPAVQWGVYEEKLAVSSDEEALSKILQYTRLAAVNESGTAYYEGADAVAEAVNDVLAGTEVEAALKNAQAALK